MNDRIANDEWYAWRLLCVLLAQHGVVINDEADLAAVIRHWGDTYHELVEHTRLRQAHADEDAAVAARLRETFQVP